MTESPSHIRPPAVAGSFYPSDPMRLKHQVEAFLAQAQRDPSARIVIAPHAGYTYSGQTAGFGFAQLRQADTVILLGVSHRDFLERAAVYHGDSWQTPLGNVTINQQVAEQLLQAESIFYLDNRAHQHEHGLEVEVPFLQVTLDDFTIVPVLMSKAQPAFIDRVAAALADIVDDRTVLVVSSDLSHYPAQSDAEQVDRQTIDAILSGDIAGFREAIRAAGSFPGLVTCACGAAAIEVGLKVAERLQLNDIRLLHYTNSGTISGDPAQGVGYAAIGFYE